MRKETDLYLNDNNVVYDIYKNKFYNPEDIVENFNRALDYDDCKSIKKRRLDHDIKYTAKFEGSEYYNLIIPVPNIGKNIDVINKMDNICRIKHMKNMEIFGIKMKKFLLRAGIIFGCGFALNKTAPVVKNVAEKIIEWDNENFERELEESGAKEMQARVERIKGETAASEARNEIYKEQAREEEKAKEERELHQQYLQNKQSLDMREQARQYQDISTMSNVIPIDEYNASYEDTTEDLPYIK